MQRPTENTDATCRAIRRNIDLVVKLEEDFLNRRTFADRIADAVGAFSGSFWFVIAHVVFYGCWILVNIGKIPGIRPFDRYPFLLLSMVVSLEAIFLSTFVLMKQNRMSRRDEKRAAHDLQINLLAEKELTLVLQMLHRISTRLGERLPGNEIDELLEETPLEALATALDQRLPKE